MNIIDTHVHIYPEKIAQKAAQSIGHFYDMPMLFGGRIAEVEALCRKNKITRCIVNSVATTPAQVQSINNFIAASVEQSGGLFAGLMTLHPDMTEAEIYAEVGRAAGLGLRGVKLHPDFQRFAIDGKEAFALYEAAQSHALPILFHTGDRRFQYSNPHRLATVLREFPRLTAIGAHFGGWSEWQEAKEVLAGLERLYVDTSSSFYAMNEAQAADLIRSFGSERVLFGSDFPMWDVGEELAFFRRMGLAEEEKERILCKNAEGLYGL